MSNIELRISIDFNFITERSDILHSSLFILHLSFRALTGLKANKTPNGDVLADFSDHFI
jgi:hypothetical protein